MGKEINIREGEPIFSQKNKRQPSFKSGVGIPLSINDLREKEFLGEELSKNERLAITAFDKYRIAILNQQKNEGAFHSKYRELQAMANLTPYEEFLNEEYFVL